MLEIITDENIMKSEEFLNDADCSKRKILLRYS